MSRDNCEPVHTNTETVRSIDIELISFDVHFGACVNNAIPVNGTSRSDVAMKIGQSRLVIPLAEVVALGKVKNGSVSLKFHPSGSAIRGFSFGG
jgi:hypothetical protein